MAELDKLQVAKSKIALHVGFWVSLVVKLKWENTGSQTPGGVAATDGRRVMYNRDVLDTWPIGDVVFVVLHEVMHNMLCHLTRFGDRNRRRANIAMDIAGNDLLEQIAKESALLGMTVPDSAWTTGRANAKFKIAIPPRSSYEAIYNLLPEDAGGGGGDKFGFDEHEAMGATPAEAEAIEKEWKVAVTAAATLAKQMGKLPGFMEEFIADLLRPGIDWRAHLQNAVKTITRDDSSWRRFNRKHLHRGTYLPGQYSERTKSIAYFCDTSGSIQSEEFKLGLGAMTELLEDMQPERIHFGQCDTDLHDVLELTVDDLPFPPLSVKGRGGTDMNPAFEWAVEHENEIDAFILQTDGYVPRLLPENLPSCQVIVICTTDVAFPAGWDFNDIIRVTV